MSGISRLANLLGLLGLSAILLVALFDQIAYHDLPCPLCLLQRAGFIAAGVGFALNLKFGVNPVHYGVTLLSALAGAGVSARQVLLHIVPGSGGYGMPLFGVHFYTWALIAFVLIGLAVGVLLLADHGDTVEYGVRRPQSQAISFAIGLFFAIALVNAVSTLLECGVGMCDDNPAYYRLLGR
jgi:disulfide bond formation protein DsbB